MEKQLYKDDSGDLTFEELVVVRLNSIYPAQMAMRAHTEIQTILLGWIAVVVSAIGIKYFFF